MKLLAATIVLALLLPAAAGAQAPVPTPTIVPTPTPSPGEPSPAEPPPVVDPPPPGTQTVTRGFDLAHSFYSAEPAAHPPFGVAWKAAFGGAVSSPLVAGGRAFVSVADNPRSYGQRVVALEAATGRELWQRPFGATYFSVMLGYGDGTLVVADRDSGLHALDPGSGEVRWSRKLEGHNSSYPIVAGGLIYVQGNNVVRAFDLATGEPRLESQLGDGTNGEPAVVGDRMYVLAACNAYALNRLTGERIWQGAGGCSGGGGSIATVAGRRVMGPSSREGDFFLDAETGARIPGRVPSQVAAGDVGIGNEAEGVVARSLESGAQLWTFAPPGALGSTYGSALAAAGETVLWRYGSVVYALDRRTGRPTWSGRLTGAGEHIGHGGIDQDFAIGDGVVLVPGHHNLWALRANAPDPAPEVTARLEPNTPVVFGTRVKLSGKLTSSGIAYTHAVSLLSDAWPFRGYAPARRKDVTLDSDYEFTIRPQRNTVVRVEASGSVSKAHGIVVLPRYATRRLDRNPGRFGRLAVTVRVPRAVRLRGRTVGVYLGRRARKRYTRLGAGRLSGGRGRYRSTFGFTTVRRMGARDFIVVCVRGIHRHGMSYGDRLDRSCGAAGVRF